MNMIALWQAGVQSPENAKNLGMIAEWWKSLGTKNVQWKQRMIPPTGQIDWNPQKFDESLVFTETDLRGITLFYRKKDGKEMGAMTPAKLEFDFVHQWLNIYPETQPTLVIRIEAPDIEWKSLPMTNPEWIGNANTDAAGNIIGYQLLIRDAVSQIEVQIEMDANSLNFLKNAIGNF